MSIQMTGTTRQFRVTEQGYSNDGIYYAPGVYSSHNLQDAEPGEVEFSVHCGEVSFVGNSLDTALGLWVAHGCPSVESINRLG